MVELPLKVGLVTLFQLTVALALGEPVFEALAISRSPLVLTVAVQVPPLPRLLGAPFSEAPVVTSPDGVVQLPDGVVQYRKEIDLIVVEAAGVNLKLWVVDATDTEDPTVKLRLVI
jgi:hypothetical protein